MIVLAVSACVSCLSTGSDGGCGPALVPPPCRCGAAAASDSISNAAPESAKPRLGGEVSIRIPKEPGTLLSIIEPGPAVRAIVDHDVLESLVRKTPDGKIEPELAVDWIVADGGRRFRFRLAPDARWHDGLPVTADDVVFTFDKLRDPANHAVLKERFEHVSRARKLGPLEAELVLDWPDPDFLGSLDSLMILPAHVFGRGVLGEHHGARAPVGSGPFRFADWEPGQRIALERNDDWRGQRPHLSKIVYRIAQDDTVALELYRRGEIDVVPGLAPRDARTEKDGRTLVTAGGEIETLVFNTLEAKLSQPAVRRAVAAAFDRRAIVCSLLDCAADLVESPWTAGDVEPLQFSLPRARALLDGSGWIDRDDDDVREKDGRTLAISVLLPDTARDLRRVAAVLQDDLRRVEIAMETEIVGWNRYLQRLRLGRFEAAFVTYSAGGKDDPRQWLHSRAIADGQNFSRIADETLDELLDELDAAKTQTHVAQLRKRIVTRLAEIQPAVFMYRPRSSTLIRKTIRGVRPVGGWFDERRMWVEGKKRSKRERES